ncbi:hypothetical protein ABIF65_003275 [Bradyrhizobium japonicum]|uniref:hypothetical protein n=1 Tax=Bradyrhizobium liaoningense TaxID=43992 RepID=UPI001BA560E3|nr:hypothetical protein [Bradyrhizobium liaoningense]MBR0945563.1 hypothetical protein [Bradyrhizobium liaoningense]MBR1034531.1 hypothetical protein [Bradyrhizobium liaoningense]MBR1070706.1 hypothetical protein [Bradyrhizobium liaoningense]
MIEADSVHSTPPLNAPVGPLSGLTNQQRERETALQTLARLRKEASARIEQLIAFLDATDPSVTTELEIDDGETGIADLDGALEQVGTQDWQQGAEA